MSLMLTSRGILDKIKSVGKSGPARSSVVSASAGAIGLAAGKSDGHKKKIVIGSVVVGAAANLVGLNGIGDGLMSGGATLIGYRLGAKKPQTAAAPAAPARKRR